MYQREMVLYTRNRSMRCWRAKRLLDRAGYRFEVVDATADPGALAELSVGTCELSALFVSSPSPYERRRVWVLRDC